MIRCILREAWREFRDSKFFKEFIVVCFCCVVTGGIAAIGYGLWKLLTWLLGEQTVALSFCGFVLLGLFIGAVKLLWRGIVALKEVMAYCRCRQKEDK